MARWEQEQACLTSKAHHDLSSQRLTGVCNDSPNMLQICDKRQEQGISPNS